MTIAYLVPNAAWVLLFGDTIIDLDGKRFYSDKADLISDLSWKGLKVEGRKVTLS